MIKTLEEYDRKFCDKVYTSNQILGKRLQKAHPNPKKVVDAKVGFMLCNSPMPSQKKIIFMCKQCNYESGQNLNLKRHIESHTANRVKTGRPKKPPGERSSVTKRLYAKRSHNAFMEDMR